MHPLDVFLGTIGKLSLRKELVFIQVGWQEVKQSVWDIKSTNCVQSRMSEKTQGF